MNVDQKEPFGTKQDVVLLFLDVDGVLNTNDRDKTKKDKALLSLSRDHIERLKTIISSTDYECKICISSAWRLNKYSLQYLKKRLIAIADIDVENVIIGQTPSIQFDSNHSHHNFKNVMEQRIFEIKTYLNNDKTLKLKYNIISWVVIDDLDLKDIGSNNFVHIDPKYGLKDNDIDLILSILNQVPLNDDEYKLKLQQIKSKPDIKLLFIAASQKNHKEININRLQIILNKTECKLVIIGDNNNKYHNIYNNSFTVNDFENIVQFITNLSKMYNIQSWAVLDYINIYQKYIVHNQQKQMLLRRFIKINPSQGLVLNDVLTTVSVLNKWSF